MHVHHCNDPLARPRSRRQPLPIHKPDAEISSAARANRRNHRRRNPARCSCGAVGTYVYLGTGYCRADLPAEGRRALAAARQLAEVLS